MSDTPTPVEDLKHTPLESLHVEAGARMVDFAGWFMPVQYSGILKEHESVRTHAGLFDISHMGEAIVSGPGAADWLNTILTNDTRKLEVSQGQYSIMPNNKGGIIDDLILYRSSEDTFFLVINASMIEEDIAWMQQHLPSDGSVSLHNASDEYAALALQGPLAAELLGGLIDSEAPVRNQLLEFTHDGDRILIGRTGYTGEDGFEIFGSTEAITKVWHKLLANESKCLPCGLGARDTLRLEACLPLNGNDLGPSISPIEAGLKMFVKTEKPEPFASFPGFERISVEYTNKPKRRSAAFVMTDKGAPPRSHYKVFAGDQEIGEVTSGGVAPTLGERIGLALVDVEFAKAGQEIEIEVRGKRLKAEVRKKPLYKRSQ